MRRRAILAGWSALMATAGCGRTGLMTGWYYDNSDTQSQPDFAQPGVPNVPGSPGDQSSGGQSSGDHGMSEVSPPETSQDCATNCLDDGDLCNGVEACDDSGTCVSLSPLACDDGVYCNGLETCEADVGCVAAELVACQIPRSICSETKASCVCEEPWLGDECAVSLHSFGAYSVTSLAQQDDLLWVGMSNGLVVRDTAGTPENFEDDRELRFDFRDGMLSGHVHGIAIDELGGKWIGGTDGLSYLDDGGTPLDKGDDQWVQLYEGKVTGLARTESGHLWLAGAEVLRFDFGGTPFDRSDDKWVTAEELGKADYLGTQVSARGSELWFTFSAYSTYLFDTNEEDWTVFGTKSYFEPKFSVRELAFAGSTGIWFLADTSTSGTHAEYSLVYAQHGGGSLAQDEFQWAQEGGFQSPRAMATDETGKLWLADEGGLWGRDPGSTSLDLSDDQMLRVAEADGFASNVSVILPEDGQGLWLGRFDGLSFLQHQGTVDPSDDRWTELSDSSIPASGATSVAFDVRNEGVWLGAPRIQFLDFGGTPTDRSDDQWLQFERPPFPMGQIRTVSGAKGRQHFWGSHTALTLTHGDTLSDLSDDHWIYHPTLKQIAQLDVLDDGRLCALSDDEALGRLHCLDEGALPLDSSDDAWHKLDPLLALDGVITSWAPGPGGDKWVGTESGLYYWNDAGTLFDANDDIWTRLAPNEQHAVRALSVAPSGGVWLALDSLVAHVDPGKTPEDVSDDSWTFFSLASLFPDGLVEQVAAGPDNTAWVRVLVEPGVWELARIDTRGTFDTPSDDRMDAFRVGEALPRTQTTLPSPDRDGGAWAVDPLHSGALYLAVSPD